MFDLCCNIQSQNFCPYEQIFNLDFKDLSKVCAKTQNLSAYEARIDRLQLNDIEGAKSNRQTRVYK